MSRILIVALVVLCNSVSVMAQPAPATRFVGTVTAIKVDTAEIVIKPDNAAPVSARLIADTVVQRIEPGAKDLKNAQPMKSSDISLGDRVLVVLSPEGTDLRRITIMSAVDITKRDEADKADWSKRGISGVVAAKIGNEITLRMRGMQGEIRATVTVTGSTTYRRYAPDSVKFVDAKVSNIDEVNVGDQLRTRGQKNEDGLKVTAEQIVFGTFVTKAGTITAVNPETKEVTLSELGTNKPLKVKLTADSQLKKMPNFGGAAPGGAPGATPPANPGAARGPGAGGSPMMMAGRGGAPPDFAAMIERMPAAKIEDLTTGQTIIVSSTKGAKSEEMTAITVLANADGLIRMVTMMSAAGGRAGAGAAGGAGPSLSGLATGLDGLNIPSITP